MIVYATTSDLTGGDDPWLAPPGPDNAASLLRYASILVAKACQLDLYSDEPVDPAAGVLRDATCAQVAAWAAQGVDPAMGGIDVTGPVKSSSILDATVQRDTTAAVQAQADARDGLCALATDLLQTAGLLWVPVPLGDSTPMLPTYGLDVPVAWGYYGPDQPYFTGVTNGWPFQ
ncbi:hypothetical protein [uncultured Jatrophihabitans sp.]|uniref:hypothetical protein n=1 Tax=uncultured Jatrophihabitans sp. TaxID=1610747 RepID=UPI0035CC80A4